MYFEVMWISCLFVIKLSIYLCLYGVVVPVWINRLQSDTILNGFWCSDYPQSGQLEPLPAGSCALFTCVPTFVEYLQVLCPARCSSPQPYPGISRLPQGALVPSRGKCPSKTKIDHCLNIASLKLLPFGICPLPCFISEGLLEFLCCWKFGVVCFISLVLAKVGKNLVMSVTWACRGRWRGGGRLKFITTWLVQCFLS